MKSESFLTVDNNGPTTLKAQKGSKDTVKIVHVTSVLQSQGQKSLGFHQKYLNLFSEDEKGLKLMIHRVTFWPLVKHKVDFHRLYYHAIISKLYLFNMAESSEFSGYTCIIISEIWWISDVFFFILQVSI